MHYVIIFDRISNDEFRYKNENNHQNSVYDDFYLKLSTVILSSIKSIKKYRFSVVYPRKVLS